MNTFHFIRFHSIRFTVNYFENSLATARIRTHLKKFQQLLILSEMSFQNTEFTEFMKDDKMSSFSLSLNNFLLFTGDIYKNGKQIFTNQTSIHNNKLSLNS